MKAEHQLMSMSIPKFTKEIISDTEQGILQAVEEGVIRPIEAHVWGKALSQIGATITKSTKERASMEVDEFKDDNLRGAKIVTANGGADLQYWEDSEWLRLKEALKAREELIKMATNTKGGHVFDDDGAQVFPVSKKQREDSIRVTFG